MAKFIKMKKLIRIRNRIVEIFNEEGLNKEEISTLINSLKDLEIFHKIDFILNKGEINEASGT